MARDERPVVKTTDHARAGTTGHNVRWVLTIGVGALVVLYAVLWFGWFG